MQDYLNFLSPFFRSLSEMASPCMYKGERIKFLQTLNGIYFRKAIYKKESIILSSNTT